ncbi:MAG TPA: TetR family transcriptional regulator [Casimicrobiaceae bacterium]|nr:TetR family transcriptional regulator [Casimicrobiaceae bacterium]
MARKTKEEAAITREQLLDAAERVFRDHGVSRASLAEVAAAAGVTRGAIYWHFRDKSDLLEALCARATMPLEAVITRIRENLQDDPLACLRAIGIEALTRLATDPRSRAIYEILSNRAELTDELTAVGSRTEQERCDCVANVEGLVRRAIEIGQLDADVDAAQAARVLHAYLGGIMRDWVDDPQTYDLAEAAPAMIDVILAGLRTHPPRRAASAQRQAASSSASAKAD